MNYRAILRDSVIVLALTGLGGFVVGVAIGPDGLETLRGRSAVGLSNIIFATIGFTIGGSLVKSNRFRHLLFVALVVWVVGLSNLFLLPGLTIVQWALSSLVILLAMGLGGGISFLFAKDQGYREPAP